MLKLFKSFNECLVSSQRMKSEFLKFVMLVMLYRSKFPIGVDTMYKPEVRLIINF